MLFSKRNNLVKTEIKLQRYYINQSLRTRLWNLLDRYYWKYSDSDDFYSTNCFGESTINPITPLVLEIQSDFFNKPYDELPFFWKNWRQEIKCQFFQCIWFKVYDFIEFLISTGFININKSVQTNMGRYSCFKDDINKALEIEHSAYRLIDNKFVPVTDDVEVGTINESASLDEPFKTAREHISSAIKLISNKKNPDYRNCIKESISAVEATCKILTKDKHATLGSALKELAQNGITIHPAFKQSINTLYGYTSDASGIRHCLTGASSVGFAEAKYMLVACSAFCNYLIEKSEKLNIKK